MTDQELKDLVASLAVDRKETERLLNEKFAETRLMQQETARQIKEVSRQLGGMGNSNGDFAEEFFYNSLRETMTFAGVHFDMISDKFRTRRICRIKRRKRRNSTLFCTMAIPSP